MLIQQLRALVADGLVRREDYREVPPRVEYALTDFGRSLRAALAPLCDWGTRHMRRIGLRHAGVNGDRKKPAFEHGAAVRTATDQPSKSGTPATGPRPVAAIIEDPSDSLASSASRTSAAAGSHAGKGMTSHSDKGMR